jgi:hypothetical protein
LEILKTPDQQLPEQVGPTACTGIAVAVAATATASVVIALLEPTGHTALSSSLHHLCLLLTVRLQRLNDPLLIGGGFCILAVVAFAVVVAVLTCPAQVGRVRSSQTLLRGLGREEDPLAAGRRIRGRGVRRPADRRPPSMPSSGRPENRPAAVRSRSSRANR